MDGVDAVLVEFIDNKPRLIASHQHPIASDLLDKLHTLADPTTADINLLGQCDSACGKLFSQASLDLLSKAKINPEQVIAIGSHGQTVRHMPSGEHPFTIQIGDANVISALTNIDTVADFRRKDIALGGQGAPLVPAFHQQLFRAKQVNRVILNIGGISNITWLPAASNDIAGFDTGPGNTLLDYWYNQHHSGQAYDQDGNWAAQGTHSPELLQQMLQHPYFSQPAPKSTGRELFNAQWLHCHLNDFNQLTPPDIQATLAQFTVETIAQEVEQLSASTELYLCGGGVFNLDLVARLKARLPAAIIDSTAALGLAPQWVEGIAFAWLAHCYIERQPANLPQVTGASRLAVLGSFFPAA